MNDVEIWKSVASLQNYEVSSHGNARRIGKEKRRLKVSKHGYHLLAVADGKGSSRNASMARLVCEAFNGPPPDGADCDHINRIRNDDRPVNLRWVSRAENLLNRQTAFGEEHCHAKMTVEAVRYVRALPFRRGQDQEVARQYGVSRETIRDVRLGKIWRHVDA